MITEIAVVKIAQEKIFQLDDVVNSLRPVLKSFSGFLAWRQIRTNGEEYLVTDILEWETMEKALKASEQMMQTPEGQAYGELMEKVLVFTHGSTAFREEK